MIHYITDMTHMTGMIDSFHNMSSMIDIHNSYSMIHYMTDMTHMNSMIHMNHNMSSMIDIHNIPNPLC